MRHNGKPRAWLLGIIPILLAGLFLIGGETHLDHQLQIAAGIGLFLVAYTLIYGWIEVYEAFVAWKEARRREPQPDGSEVDVMVYSGESPLPPRSAPIRIDRRIHGPAEDFVEVASSFQKRNVLNVKEKWN